MILRRTRIGTELAAVALVTLTLACSRRDEPAPAGVAAAATAASRPPGGERPPATAPGARSELAELIASADAGARVTTSRGDASTAIDVARSAESYFPNVELVDQDGKPHRFYADLLRGKIALVSFGFTRCKGACNPIMRNLAKVQRALGDRVGKDIVMITISVDPVSDPPSAMKAFGARYGVGPKGWYLLSGVPANVAAVLERLGAATGVPEEHSTVLLIGDLRTGTWTKTVGFTPPEEIVHAVEHLND